MVNSNRDRISYRLHVCDLFSRIGPIEKRHFRHRIVIVDPLTEERPTSP